MFRQTEQGIKDCSGGSQVLKSLLWPRIISHKNIKEYPFLLLFILSILLLSLFFYSFPPRAVSIHCRLMHLTNHWARKGINSYSKQRAIMGTLVVRKLRIFQPARRYARITEHFYTLFSKHSLGQAWKERGGRDFNWQDMARRGEGGRGSVPWMHGYRPLLLKQLVPQRPNHQMTWWSSLQWQTDNETAFHSFMCLEQCAYKHHFFVLCACVHACVFTLVLISLCI